MIAITGGIGSGKSTVCEILSKLGYVVYDCDEIAKDLANQEEVIDQVKKLFGDKYVNVNGKLDRIQMREIFENEEQVRQLNSLFHPLVFKKLNEIASKSNTLAFVEVSVSSSIPNNFFKQVWVITANKDTRIKRVVFRDNVFAEKVEKIIDVQEDYQKPTLVIHNDGYIDDLKVKVTKILEKINK